MKTDISSVVYTVDTAGTVQFYEFKGKSYDPIDPTGTMDVTVSLSGQQIPAKIYYVERDGVLTGYGVYTAQSAQTPVYIYDFVMFRVANLPSAYAADGKCLLLLHTDAQRCIPTMLSGRKRIFSIVTTAPQRDFSMRTTVP